MTASLLELVRRHLRLALTSLGTLYVLIFVRLTQRQQGRSSGGILSGAILDDDVVFTIAMFMSVVVLAGFGYHLFKSVRNPTPPRPSFWRTDKAMFLSVVIFLIGAGLLCAWVTEWQGDDEGGLAFFATGALVVGTACCVERGRLPALALLAGVFAGSVAALIRIAFGRDHYAGAIVAFGILGLFLFPLAYLLIRGLLNLVSSRSSETGGGTGFGLPLQVVAQHGTYLVTVEAPGLDDAGEVEAKVSGSQLHLVVVRPTSNDGELLYSTRCSGRFPVVIDLPQPLQDPWDVSVKHGLVTVQVAPLGDT
jgi:HSP20 family molecular chaperone IbpA